MPALTSRLDFIRTGFTNVGSESCNGNWEVLFGRQKRSLSTTGVATINLESREPDGVGSLHLPASTTSAKDGVERGITGENVALATWGKQVKADGTSDAAGRVDAATGRVRPIMANQHRRTYTFFLDGMQCDCREDVHRRPNAGATRAQLPPSTPTAHCHGAAGRTRSPLDGTPRIEDAVSVLSTWIGLAGVGALSRCARENRHGPTLPHTGPGGGSSCAFLSDGELQVGPCTKPALLQ
jgi:hypothetical protein